MARRPLVRGLSFGLAPEDVAEGLAEIEALASGDVSQDEGDDSAAATIRAAMEGARRVRLTYRRKRDGVTARYEVRAYEAKPHPSTGRLVLYGQDDRHGSQIHSFLWDRIERATPTRRRFLPTWPVRPRSVPT